jgi:DNA-binding NtrC family response regulator
LTGARVLIVEDDDAIRGPLERVFSRGGLIVCSAKDGKEALHLLESGAPDLIVLDLMLPWVNGIQLLTTVRQHPRLAKVPVLVAGIIGATIPPSTCNSSWTVAADHDEHPPVSSLRFQGAPRHTHALDG